MSWHIQATGQGSHPPSTESPDSNSAAGRSSASFADAWLAFPDDESLTGATSRSPYFASTGDYSDMPFFPRNFAVWPAISDFTLRLDGCWPRLPTRKELFSRRRIERKLRNPAATDAIGHKAYLSRRRKIYGFVFRFLGYYVYCYCISIFWPYLGLNCAPLASPYDETQPSSSSSHRLESTEESSVSGYMPEGAYNFKDWDSPIGDWVFLICACALLWLLGQGLFGMRAVRERMERVHSLTLSLAYSLLKTTNPIGEVEILEQFELERVIYECLALLVAFPVATVQQVKSNSCEPAVARYCHEASSRLQALRAGEAVIGGVPAWRRQRHGGLSRELAHFVPVDHFFEIFSLQLEREYKCQKMRNDSVPMTCPHIMYNLRNHLENLIDAGYMDERKSPGTRDVIETLYHTGRECSLNHPRDTMPCVLIWMITICVGAFTIFYPVNNCDYMVNSELRAEGINWPTLNTMINMFSVAALCSAIVSLLGEAWDMWDPFGRGVNTYAWSLGIAMEVDMMLNDFYEFESSMLIRKHSFMDIEGPPKESSKASSKMRSKESVFTI